MVERQQSIPPKHFCQKLYLITLFEHVKQFSALGRQWVINLEFQNIISVVKNQIPKRWQVKIDFSVPDEA